MAACANCNKAFEKKSKGFFRFSLESLLPLGNQSARDILSSLTGSSFTPVSSKRKGQFMCPECWSSLNKTIRYQHSVNEFWKRTEDDTYIYHKRKSDSPRKSPIKKICRITSTPCQVSFFLQFKSFK